MSCFRGLPISFHRSCNIGLVVVCTALVGCGGGTESDLSANERERQRAQLLAQAEEKESEARNLADEAPCEQDNQCSIMYFHKACPDFSDRKVYSLISPTAGEAEAAHASRAAIVEEANKLLEPYNCTGGEPHIPPPVCSLGTCEFHPDDLLVREN